MEKIVNFIGRFMELKNNNFILINIINEYYKYCRF